LAGEQFFMFARDRAAQRGGAALQFDTWRDYGSTSQHGIQSHLYGCRNTTVWISRGIEHGPQLDSHSGRLPLLVVPPPAGLASFI